MRWDVHPDRVEGEIGVAPVIIVAEATEPDLTGIVGESLETWRAAGRLERTAELNEWPHDFRAAVPGAVFAALPSHWEGHFRDMRFGFSQQHALMVALRDHRQSFTRVMRDVAMQASTDAVLFTWVLELEGHPLTDEHLVGELVIENGVPLLVEHSSEPYRVETEVGVALVSRDGELLFRYQDEYTGLLSAQHDSRSLAHDIAASLIDDIVPLWLEVSEQRIAVADTPQRP